MVSYTVGGSPPGWSNPPAVLGLVGILFNLLNLVLCSGRILPPVHWNSSNIIFNTSNDHHIIDVQILDKLKILCPVYETSQSKQKFEYYRIEFVNLTSYDLCAVNEPRQNTPILTCDTPQVAKSFTILIWEVQAIPGVPDFVKGTDYYLISTSGPSQFGLGNQYGGACKEHNMRLILRVRDSNKEPGEVTVRPGGGTTRRPDTQRTTPTPPTTTTTTTTTSTSTKKPTTRKKPPAQTDSKVDGEINPDGFPDETVIHAGDGGNNVNSGIIEDNGASNSGLSVLHHRHSVIRGWILALLGLLLIQCLVLR